MHIRLKIDARIAEIVLARPEKLNAVTPEMAAEMQRTCIDIDRDNSVRAVLFAGEGSRAFSAGSDLEFAGCLSVCVGLPQPHRIRGRRARLEEARRGGAKGLGAGRAVQRSRSPRISASATSPR